LDLADAPAQAADSTSAWTIVAREVLLKQSLLPLLTCASCAGPFTLNAEKSDGAEVIEGTLICQRCNSSFPITRGIPRFLGKNMSADQKATADAFGYEWTHYSKLTDADSREFLDWMAPLTPRDFDDRVILDAGCGKGRHAFLAARFKARTVIGIDLSNAVEAAYQNTRDLPNVHIVQADIMRLPFAQPFDLIYSIGVLHHLPIPKSGFLALTKHVKHGGRISVWVYGKEGNRWIELIIDPLRKNITSRLPRVITRGLSFIPAVILYLSLKLLYRPAKRWGWLKRLLPYSDYLCSIADYSFAENFWNVFDQLVAPTAYYHTEEEVIDWFRTAQASNVRISRHNSNSWRGTGLMSVESTQDDMQAKPIQQELTR
jgi:SAM-dependent methyltransferase